MALKNTSMVITFEAWDVSGTPATRKSGDAANISCVVSKDGGGFSASTNSVSELGSTGVYKLTLTATERNADHVKILPTSVTADVLCNAVDDYPETNNSGVGEQTVTISVEDASEESVGDASVVVKTEAGTTVASGTTDDDTGQIVFQLDDGDYLVYVKKSQYSSITPSAANLTVSGDTEETYTVTYVDPSTPSGNTQTCFGNVMDLTGSYVQSARITAKVEISDQTVSSSILTMDADSTTSDASGDFELTLLQGAQVTITVYNHGQKVWEKEITVTTDATKNLSSY